MIRSVTPLDIDIMRLLPDTPEQMGKVASTSRIFANRMPARSHLPMSADTQKANVLFICSR